MDRAERLLERGYFPSQLPPSFTTSLLAKQYGALLALWSVLDPKAPSSKPELYSVARAGHHRRVISLPNPVSQTFLSAEVAKYWGQIVQHYRKSRLSASHPRFLANGARAANLPSMRLLYERKVLLSAGFKVMLRTDVSRFFPTVYTHSVPWALHGKAPAKKNRRKLTASYYGNLIDRAIRQGQDEQTMGLPIGPDTSHIIAEAIATSLDLALKARLKGWPAGFRYVDDYYLFFQTTSEAETALALLSRALKEFELQLNFEKTTICSASEIAEDYWTHQLRSFQLGSAGKRQRADIHHYFDLAKDLARRNTDENVMKYALKRSSSALIRKENWDAFEAHLCHAALAFPNTLQTVAKILSTYNHHGYAIDADRISRLLYTLIQDHAPLGHHNEVAWSLWLCKELKITLDVHTIDLIADMHSSVCALILLDMEAAGSLTKAVKQVYWRQFMTTEALCEDMWLLAYEAGVRRWGGFNEAHIAGDAYFNELRMREVRFYDSTAKMSPVFDVKEGTLDTLQLNSIADLFDREDASDYLEYEEDDGGYDDVVMADFEDDANHEQLPDSQYEDR